MEREEIEEREVASMLQTGASSLKWRVGDYLRLQEGSAAGTLQTLQLDAELPGLT